ncbi:hypothetical protein F4678DRAFT_449109 [Xylaria arbuscula]|nr:hypothetical protein F4678DRAFT_449109 [Xylaria arbuscula]
MGDPREPVHRASFVVWDSDDSPASEDSTASDETPTLDETPIPTPSDSTKEDNSMDQRDSPSSDSSTLGGSTSVFSVPEPGGIYIIRHTDSDRAMTLVEGRVTLVEGTRTGGGWQWICEELPEGYLGFRDVVQGKYLGRDNKGGFYAQVGRQGSWESFVLRPREAGGYNLCVRHWFSLKALSVADAEEPSPRLIEVPITKEAARWEFVKVDSKIDS